MAVRFENPPDDVIRDLFLKYKNIAVVGFSKNRNKPAHKVPRFFIGKRYNIIPVNPTTDKILGRKSYPNVSSIPDPVDWVDVFRPPEAIPEVVEDVLRRLDERGDVKVFWLQEGIRNDEAVAPLVERGLIVVQDRCMWKEYMRLIEGVDPDKVELK
ncbi:MAG: CoA-binding protein [Thermotogae bacterium]|nr:CoA-binding protein [Thermotogota bacterium]